MESNEPLLHERSKWYFPRRHIIFAFVSTGLLLAYVIRVILSVAILTIADQREWDADQQGLALSAFYWGYIITQLPGGYLAKRFGGKIMFCVGVAWASVFNVAFAWSTHSLPLAIAMRVFTGLGEGVIFSSCYVLSSAWIPIAEKTTFSGMITGSYSVGTVITLGVSASVISSFGWEPLFWGTSVFCGAWAVAFFVCGRDVPRTGFTLFPPSQAEIQFIENGLLTPEEILAQEKSDAASETSRASRKERIETMGVEVTLSEEEEEEEKKKNEPFPWRTLLSHPAVIVLIFNHFAYNWNYYVFVSWLPTYMKRELKFELEGIFDMLPYLIFPVISLGSGMISDWLVSKKGLEKLTARKFFQCSSCFFPACLLVIISFVDMTPVATLAVMVLAISTSGFAGGGYSVNFMDLTKDHIGLLFAISNTVATIPGIFGVYLTGYILRVTDYNWKIVFLLTSAIDVLAMYSYMVWAKASKIA